MKSHAIIVLVLAALFCDPASPQTMPTERPADLRVSYYDGGGMLPGESIVVTQDSLIHEQIHDTIRNRWKCTPTAEGMDKLWAQLVQADAINIRTEDRGTVDGRGGSHLHLSYGQTNVKIIDADNMFVVDEDIDRFIQAGSEIFRITDACTESLAVPLELSLILETQGVKVRHYSVGLKLIEVISMTSEEDPELPKPYSDTILPGEYLLSAFAQFDRRFISMEQIITISPEKHSFQIVLKSDTFELHQ